MRPTLMYGAHDVRVETVPDAQLVEPTDALVRVTRACICGSDLWPVNSCHFVSRRGLFRPLAGAAAVKAAPERSKSN
jgi:threonine dehydrogenase-like Zn-dependent dehydrogenase